MMTRVAMPLLAILLVPLLALPLLGLYLMAWIEESNRKRALERVGYDRRHGWF